jgi:hypothetical protein
VLSANDIQHVVGLLYAATSSQAKVITLGEKVWDAESRRRRDVDVVILT